MISNVYLPKIKYDIKTYRYHRKEETSPSAKMKIAGGALVGTVVPLMMIAKSPRNIFKVNYGLKEMLMISTGSITGGILAGLAFDKKEHRKQKVNEGVFQLMNSTVPAVLTASLIALIRKIKPGKNTGLKIGVTAVGLLGGMLLATKLANRINDPYDKVPDRKLTIKDALANVDDAMSIFVVSKVPVADKIPVEKFLPVIYSWCGYRAGTSN